ncbi:MAG TPA: Hsp20/alpha crystallin family protein [Ktedonobacterales bacterium]|nr:Hsp20/alpha crystallin family protein [Ktedonobacterales bacterium]
MRLRYRSVTYRYMQGSEQELERRYHQLWHELVRQSQQQTLLHRPSQWRPPADIHETPNAITVKIELAGMRAEDIDVTLYDDALVVSGERHDDHEHDNTICYHEAQIRYGPFRVEIIIPFPIERTKVEAEYDDGFLKVLLPKAAPSEPKPVQLPGKDTGQKTSEGGRNASETSNPDSHSNPRHYHAPASRTLTASSKGDTPHA